MSSSSSDRRDRIAAARRRDQERTALRVAADAGDASATAELAARAMVAHAVAAQRGRSM